MAAKINVRIAQVHSIYKEEGEGAGDDGRPYDIHITGFDADGHPVRPIISVPRTRRVMMAINEGRLIDVDRAEGGAADQEADVKRLKDWHTNQSAAGTAQYGSSVSDESNKAALGDLGIIKTQDQKQADEQAAKDAAAKK